MMACIVGQNKDVCSHKRVNCIFYFIKLCGCKMFHKMNVNFVDKSLSLIGVEEEPNFC